MDTKCSVNEDNKMMRLILSNQYEILGNHQMAEDLRNGYSFFYDNIFKNIDETLPEKIHKYVMEILQKHEDLNIKFPGFDNNEESIYFNYVVRIFEDGRFSSIRPDDCNSHVPMMDIYKNKYGIAIPKVSFGWN